MIKVPRSFEQKQVCPNVFVNATHGHLRNLCFFGQAKRFFRNEVGVSFLRSPFLWFSRETNGTQFLGVRSTKTHPCVFLFSLSSGLVAGTERRVVLRGVNAKAAHSFIDA